MIPLPSIDEIIKNASEFSKNNKLSCFIQFLIENESEDIIDKIFESIKNNIVDLTKDFYGNYVIQGILDRGGNKGSYIYNELVKKEIIIELCTKKYSCRVIQKLVDKMDDNSIIKMLPLLENNLNKLFINQNGNHVIQKIIKKLKEEDLECIYNTALKKINELIKDQYGIRIIEGLFNKFTDK